MSHELFVEPLERRQFLSAAKLSSISGSVYSDLNLNAAHDAGEAGAKGVYVFLDLNGNGKYDKKTEPFSTTGKRGEFSFAGLKAGTYRLREIVTQSTITNSKATISSISVVSTPTAGWFKIKLAAGQDIVRRQFGNATFSLITAPPADGKSTSTPRVAGNLATNASANAFDVTRLAGWIIDKKRGTISQDSRQPSGGGGSLSGDTDFSGKIDGGDYSTIDSSFNTQRDTIERALAWLDAAFGARRR